MQKAFFWKFDFVDADADANVGSTPAKVISGGTYLTLVSYLRWFLIFSHYLANISRTNSTLVLKVFTCTSI